MRAVESNSKMCGREHASRACNTVGRFAPSPSGELHFGSLVAAVGSFFDTRARNGRWLVRIEDLDPPRTVAGSAERQLGALARFGLIPDEPASYQSRFRTRHDALPISCACSTPDWPTRVAARAGICPPTGSIPAPAGKESRPNAAPAQSASGSRTRLSPFQIRYWAGSVRSRLDKAAISSFAAPTI